tara:strand:- start:1121 stop:1291 length:171 start_codon:yes stop_codon:yes gene_type:complete
MRGLRQQITRRTNGAKKTRQGLSKQTIFGSIPDTSHMFVSSKSLNRYKKKYRGQGK